MAVEMKYGDYVKGGWDLIKSNLVPAIVTMVVMVVCCIIPVVGAFLAMHFQVVFLKLLKENKESGKAIEIGQIFNFDNIVNNILAMFIAGLFGICCFFPYGLVIFTPCLLADRPGIGFMDAVKGAFAFGKQNILPSIILAAIMLVLLIVGEIALLIGVFITMPIWWGALWCAYLDQKAAIHAAAAEAGITLS